MTSFPRNRATAAGRTPQKPFTVWRRAFKDNVTSTDTIDFSVPTTTPPSTATAGVHELEPGEGLIIKPYGTDAADEQFRLAIELWHPLYDRLEGVRETETIVWIPTTIFLNDPQMHTGTGAAAGPLDAGDLFCDVFAKLTGVTNSSAQAYFTSTNNTDDYDASDGTMPTKASVMVNLATWGARYVQFHIDVNGSGGSAAASGNTLFAVI